MADLELRGERLTLRRVVEPDVPAIASILAEPAVGRWWGSYDEGRVRREMLQDPGVEAFVIEIGAEVAGVLYVSEERDPDYRHAGLDIGLATAYQGRGYGREALRLAIDHLVAEHGHHRFTIDPEAGNGVAIRCYEAVGFRPVGLMREYERGPDGTWVDGLLMELIVEQNL